MRYRYGPIPENPTFSPETEGWARLREPGLWTLQVIAVPVAIGTLVVSGALLFLAFPRQQLLRYPELIGKPGWLWVVLLVLIIPVHELVHAVLHPDWGLTARSVIGLWLSKAVFYAHYDGPVSRNRQLLVLAGPYLALSLLPIGLLALAPALAWPLPIVSALAFVSLAGGMLAAGDLISVVLLAWQVPSGATVRNQGWRTYWKRESQRHEP